MSYKLAYGPHDDQYMRCSFQKCSIEIFILFLFYRLSFPHSDPRTPIPVYVLIHGGKTRMKLYPIFVISFYWLHMVTNLGFWKGFYNVDNSAMDTLAPFLSQQVCGIDITFLVFNTLFHLLLSTLWILGICCMWNRISASSHPIIGDKSAPAINYKQLQHSCSIIGRFVFQSRRLAFGSLRRIACTK